jgi:hypothetical protein
MCLWRASRESLIAQNRFRGKLVQTPRRQNSITSELATIRALLITIGFPRTDAAFALLARICDSELQRTLTGKGLALEPRVSFDVHFLDPL